MSVHIAPALPTSYHTHTQKTEDDPQAHVRDSSRPYAASEPRVAQPSRHLGTAGSGPSRAVRRLYTAIAALAYTSSAKDLVEEGIIESEVAIASTTHARCL